jgi:hypothetical protein
MKKIHLRKTLRPKGPWLTDADLRHDAAINLACPAYRRGDRRMRKIDIQIPCASLREFQQQHGDHHLVVNPHLIDLLAQKYLLTTEISGSPPQSMELVGYPMVRFRAEINGTRRVAAGRVIPGPLNYLTFWAIPKKVVLNA